MPTPQRDRVFVSYSHKDKEWLEKFSAVLAPDIRNGRVDYWDDRELQSGDPWYSKILDGIDAARVAVLLVSPNFLASRFIMEEELPRILAARGDGITIIWVPLFGTFYGPGAPPQIKPLTEVQAAFDASKPLAEQDPASQTTLLLDLCHQIQRLINPGRVPSNLPFNSLAELFKGRDESLTQLDRSLRQHGSAAIVQPQAIHGLGGIGKTRLAIEYAWRHQDDFTAFLFVSANTPDDLDRNLAALCRPDSLDLPENQSPKQDEQRDAVIRWLQQNRGWLLILDNVDTDEGVRAAKTLVAKLRGGHVLITSRVTEWGRGVRPLALDVLQPLDAVALLLESAHSWRASRSDDGSQARTLADCLGCLPLALTHATAYMQHHHQGFTAYLIDFEKHFERLLAYHDHLAIEYETELEVKTDKPVTAEAKAARKKFVKTVATTFFLSFDRLASEAKAILQSAAFLAPDPIPAAMFEQCPDEMDVLVNLWCKETSTAKSGQSVADALAELARYSLISRGEGVFNIHRMEQLVLRSRVAKDRWPEWIEGTRSVLCKYAPDETAENPNTWPVWNLLRPHAEVLVAFAKDDSRVQPHLALLEAMGQLYFGKALYRENLAVDEIAVKVAESLHGPESDEMAHRLLAYGETLRVLGRFNDAESAFRRSLAIRERSDGPETLSVASVLNYVAIVLSDLGREQESELLHRRVLAIYDSQEEKANKLDVIKTLSNLGVMVAGNGDLVEAESLLRRAVSIAEKHLEPEHYLGLFPLSILGRVLARKGDLEQAETLCRTTLRIRESVLGPDHPHTLQSANGLAEVLMRRGNFPEAVALSRRVLATETRTLGPDHPAKLSSAQTLAVILEKKGDYAEAEEILRQNLGRSERLFGADNPRTLTCLNNLALVLESKGDGISAAETCRLALDGRKRVLGDDHTDTIQSLGDLARLLENLGRFEEAFPLRQRVLETQERKFGSEHPDTLRSWNQHAHALRKQGRAGQAEPIDRKTSATTTKILGETNPLTIHRRNNLVLTLILLGKLAEARQILAASWRLIAPPRANTTPRIALLRCFIAALELQPGTLCLGQLKTLLTGPKLPVAEDVSVPWDIAYFIEHLKPNLGEHNAEFLTALVAALNDPAKLPDLDRFPEWNNQLPIPLDVPWPEK